MPSSSQPNQTSNEDSSFVPPSPGTTRTPRAAASRGTSSAKASTPSSQTNPSPLKNSTSNSGKSHPPTVRGMEATTKEADAAEFAPLASTNSNSNASDGATTSETSFLQDTETNPWSLAALETHESTPSALDLHKTTAPTSRSIFSLNWMASSTPPRTSPSTPLSFRRYRPSQPTHSSSSNDPEFHVLDAPEESTGTPRHWTRGSNYNATHAVEHAQAMRTRVHAWILWLGAVGDALVATLALLYATALWMRRMYVHSNHGTDYSALVVLLWSSVGLGGLYGLRAMLVLFVGKRLRSTRMMRCVSVATMGIALVLATLYAVALGVLWYQCGAHQDMDPSTHNATIVPTISPTTLALATLAPTTLAPVSLDAAAGPYAASDPSTCHWVTDMVHHHRHAWMIPSAWAQHVPWDSLVAGCLLCGVVWELCARAGYAYASTHRHVDADSTPRRVHDDWDDWQERDDANDGTTTLSLWPVTSSGRTESRSWWRRPTTFRRHEPTDEDAHLFAALSEDWADRSRDDPLWWSRD